MLLLACMRGNIFVYQGEELGLPQAQIAFEQLRDPEAIANWPMTLGRDGARTPMPWSSNASQHSMAAQAQSWLPVAAEHRALAVDAQESDPNSQLAYTRRALALRNRHNALTNGAIHILEASDSILAFERGTQEQRLLCVFNLGSDSRAWRPSDPEHWQIIESSQKVEGWTLPRLAGLVAQRSL
jgi:alpha-glucosidase